MTKLDIENPRDRFIYTAQDRDVKVHPAYAMWMAAMGAADFYGFKARWEEIAALRYIETVSS